MLLGEPFVVPVRAGLEAPREAPGTKGAVNPAGGLICARVGTFLPSKSPTCELSLSLSLSAVSWSDMFLTGIFDPSAEACGFGFHALSGLVAHAGACGFGFHALSGLVAHAGVPADPAPPVGPAAPSSPRSAVALVDPSGLYSVVVLSGDTAELDGASGTVLDAVLVPSPFLPACRRSRMDLTTMASIIWLRRPACAAALRIAVS